MQLIPRRVIIFEHLIKGKNFKIIIKYELLANIGLASLIDFFDLVFEDVAYLYNADRTDWYKDLLIVFLLSVPMLCTLCCLSLF